MITKLQPDYQTDLKEVSPLGINLVKKLLEKDVYLRLSATECLAHPWF